MDYYGISDIGLVRGENQDACTALKLCSNATLLIVCDGMGGENGGKTASTTAVRVFSEAVQKSISGYITRNRFLIKHKNEIPIVMSDALDLANETVHIMAREDINLSGMGTTLVAAFIVGRTVYVINVGDSRAYIASDSNIKQITKDHSYVQFLLDTGRITEEEFRNHPQKSIITRSVGVDNYVLPDIYKAELKSGQCLMLCTDGLSGSVDESDMKRIIAAEVSLEDKAAELIELAKQNGSSDNITVLLAEN